ncbi:MAG: hypothetical protein MZV64_12010 [Ignavibacteriales bacterium]|nr:hypothetical protein [Ignavibacteriales bacterium]
MRALSLRAIAYLSLGGEANLDKASADAAKAIALDLADKPIHFVLGEVHRERALMAFASGDKKRAQELSSMALADYRIALEADRSSWRSSTPSRTRGEGDPQEAVRVYAESFEKDGYSVVSEKALGDVLGLFASPKAGAGSRKIGEPPAGSRGPSILAGASWTSAAKSYTRALELGDTGVLYPARHRLQKARRSRRGARRRGPKREDQEGVGTRTS